MNENTSAAGSRVAPRGCGRAADLMAYLYGEAGPAEMYDFRLHLNACAACRDELAAFGGVRARVGEWRAEALSAAPLPDLSGAFAPAATAQTVPPRSRSARAALREFFSLSPLWLRAGALAATLLVCALAALAFARAEIRWDANGLAVSAGVDRRTAAEVEKVEAPPAGGFTEAQVEAVVEERVRQELSAAERRWRERQEQEAGTDAPEETLKKPAPHVETASNRNAPPRKRAAPRAAARGRQRPEDEESLPRLSDLLSGVY